MKLVPFSEKNRQIFAVKRCARLDARRVLATDVILDVGARSRLPEPPQYLGSATAAMWLEKKSRGYWLTSADRFLVEIAAALMAHYRIGELNSGDVSLLIGLLGNIGFSLNERGRMNLPTNSTWGQALSSAIFQFVILRALRKSGWSRSSSYHRRGWLTIAVLPMPCPCCDRAAPC